MAQVPVPFRDIPGDIEHHRQFSLDQPVSFLPAVYEKYFPYIDNVWCFHDSKGKVSYKTGMLVLRGACRLNRKPDNKRPSTAKPERKRREGTGTCEAKFKVTVMPDGMRVFERYEDTAHSHDLDYLDSIKRNNAVRKIILHDYFKSWDAGAILAYLRDPVQKVGDRDLLKEAGGHYITRTEISNIMTRALQKAHPGEDPFEIKRQQDKYKTYKSCSIKGCTAAPFATAKDLKMHKREVHGVKKHDHSGKIPCPDPTCSRRKQSRGFASITALQEHQRRFHGIQPDVSQNSVDEQAMAAVLQTGTPVDDGATKEDESSDDSDDEDDEAIAAAADGQISDSARRHMGDRLAKMEKERMRLDREISALRHKLYGDSTVQTADTQMADIQMTAGAEIVLDDEG